jgi:hypothetical protein
MFGSSESWAFNSAQFHGTHVPVEEPSTASKADVSLCKKPCLSARLLDRIGVVLMQIKAV